MMLLQTALYTSVDGAAVRSPQTRWTMNNDQAIEGNSIFSALGYTKNQCFRACSLTEGCSGANFDRTTAACTLFDSVDNLIATPDTVSASGTPDRHWVGYDGYLDDSHPYIDGPWKISKKTCATRCRIFTGCLYYSHHSGECKLYDTLDSSKIVWGSIGDIHGSVPYAPVVERGIELKSQYSSFLVNVSSAESCDVECLYNDDCMYWTFKTSHKKCYLHNGRVISHAVEDRIENADAISGSTRSFSTRSEDIHVLPNHHYGVKYQMTEELCRTACAHDARCIVYNFVGTNGACNFKDRFNGSEYMSDATASNSALDPFIDVGMMYEGTVVDTFRDTERNCRAGCLFHPECNFYTSNINDLSCTLLSVIDSRTANSSYTSGSKPLYPNAQLDQRFVSPTDQVLGHLMDSMTLLQCEKLCYDHPECVAYNFLNNNCELLKGYDYLVQSAGYKSDFKAEDPLLMKNVGIEDAGVLHALVGNVEVEDNVTCAIECSETSSCKFWHFASGSGSNCWLFRSAGAFVSASGASDASVGSKPAPYWEKDQRSIADGIQTLNQPPPNQVVDAFYCNLYCGSQPDCNYWSFNKSQETCTAYRAYISDQRDPDSVMGSSPLRKTQIPTNGDLVEIKPGNPGESKALEFTSFALIVGCVFLGFGLGAGFAIVVTVTIKTRRRGAESDEPNPV